ncbi:hypothetical protein NKH18_50360 [Streptomyces sp. M10(2022)]
MIAQSTYHWAVAEFALDVAGARHQRDQQIGDAHGAGDDDRGVAQEAEALGDLQALGGLRSADAGPG